MRIKILRLITVVLFIIILAGLFFNQVIRGEYYHHLSTNNRIRVIPMDSWRGRIFDRNGQLLADNRLTYNVSILPQEIRDSQKLFDFLSQALNVDRRSLVSLYHKRKSAAFAPVLIAEGVSREQAIVLHENKYRFPSLLIDEHFMRVYPLGLEAAHVVGYVGKASQAEINRLKDYGYAPQEVIGKTGVERNYDSLLKGDGGGVQIEVDSRGRQVRLLGIKDPVEGQDISLTVDAQLQKLATGLLNDRIGAIVVMDADNGEVLALTSSPSFDPNWFLADNQRQHIASILSDRRSPVLNRAIKGAYPPGSVFKIPVAIAGLDTKKISPATTFRCPGYYELGGMKFGCTYAHGPQNLYEAIAHSCNVFFYNAGKIIGAEKLSDYARRLGLGERTYIDLPFEEQGHIPNSRKGLLSVGRRWYTGDTLNFSIGQGDVLVTPIQLARLMAVIARNGYEIQPHVIKDIGGIAVEKFSGDQRIQIGKGVLKTIEKGLRATVTDYAGTAHALDVPGLFVAGKTGTAQSSPGKAHHAWFAGYARGKTRNIAFCVFLEHGGSSHNSVYIARDMLELMQNEKML